MCKLPSPREWGSHHEKGRVLHRSQVKATHGVIRVVMNLKVRNGVGRGEGETREGKGGGVGRQRTIPELVQRRAVEWRCLTRAADDKG